MEEQVSVKLRHETGPRLPLRSRLLRLGFCLARDILFSVRIVGCGNIPASNAIVVANHLSWIDHLLLWTVLPAEPRLILLGAGQSNNSGFKDWLLRTFGGIIVFERGASWVGKDTLRKPVQTLENGASLLLFPEGNVGPNEGELGPLLKGVGHIVLRAPAACPVLPIALSGVKELYWRKEMQVIIGSPLHVKVEGLDHRHAVDAAVNQVESALKANIPP
ncbi:MAG: lysophospholipid acyltransferase family protein, partial [Rudaea sp.]